MVKQLEQIFWKKDKFVDIKQNEIKVEAIETPFLLNWRFEGNGQFHGPERFTKNYMFKNCIGEKIGNLNPEYYTLSKITWKPWNYADSLKKEYEEAEYEARAGLQFYKKVE